MLLCFVLSCCVVMCVVHRNSGVTVHMRSVTRAARDEVTLSKRALFINLKHQKPRRLHITKLLTDMGFRPEHIEPVPADTGWKSLVRTHKLCVELVSRDNSAAYICIFEDDAELSPDVKRSDARGFIESGITELQLTAPSHVEFIKLGACLDTHQEQACSPAACQSWCTHAYALTPRMARTLLKTKSFDWLNHHSDFAYMNLVPSPPLIGHSITHDTQHPGWRGLFFQDRKSWWYEGGMSEKGYDNNVLR